LAKEETKKETEVGTGTNEVGGEELKGRKEKKRQFLFGKKGGHRR